MQVQFFADRGYLWQTNTRKKTLTFKFYCSDKTFDEKVDLFVDMGGF